MNLKPRKMWRIIVEFEYIHMPGKSQQLHFVSHNDYPDEDEAKRRALYGYTGNWHAGIKERSASVVFCKLEEI